MSKRGCCMRAFRPSHYAPMDEYDEEEQRMKDANVLRYAERAEARLPLFDGITGGMDPEPQRLGSSVRS